MASLAIVLSSKNSRICSSISTGGEGGRPIIGLPGLPSMGMPLMRPTPLLVWFASVTISLVTSYSRNRSRSVDRKGRLDSVSVEFDADDAEIAHLAFLVEANALEAGGDGAILGVGERLGIEEGDLQLAARDAAVLLEQGAHALEHLGVARCRFAQLLGEVDADVDRLVDGPQGFARALGDRVEALLGEIEPGIAQRARGDQVDGQQDDGAQRQAAPRQRAAIDAARSGSGAVENARGFLRRLSHGKRTFRRLCADR